MTIQFHQVGRLPEPEDNVAITIRRLEAGTQILLDSGAPLTLSHTLLEGHRFAVRPIPAGMAVLSWGLPFGTATQDIAAGAYVCNTDILEALRVRRLDFQLPEKPNFKDWMEPYQLDEATFVPGKQIPLFDHPVTFRGFRRSANRGCGTRNYIVLLGTTSQTASFVKRLENRLQGACSNYPNIDGIVAVAHTEGGTSQSPNNEELLLRTLSGCMVHPNVGAVLAVDYGTEAITNEKLLAFLTERGYALSDVPHAFLSLEHAFETELERATSLVTSWLDQVNRSEREELPASHLKVALQCGGSDAFSGVSANPLLAWVAKDLIRAGGSANLAETDELIGAESYVLDNVRDLETARTFLHMIERFKERVAWHGQTVDANPSGGNKFRGIYNIVLKSIGAARKRHPDVRLDYAIEYGEPMTAPGYYFMDSPGNDLEGIAGQVASGCNLIFFTTGNGSITNFPFVPTVKIVTTTKRFELLSKDMDVNAGAYLDGVPMEKLGDDLFDLTLRIASGTRSVGEQAGHAQVSIWRNWPQADAHRLTELLEQAEPDGNPIPLKPSSRRLPVSHWPVRAYRADGRSATDRVGLILPTSLCSSQIARMAAERMNRKGLAQTYGLSQFLSLPHTEGCGVSGGPSEVLYARTMVGYLTHPMVACALLLEHGCERTHNDYYRQKLQAVNASVDRFGWASVQLDGGIDKVLNRVEEWFTETLDVQARPELSDGGLSLIRLGLPVSGPVTAAVATSLADLTRLIVAAGGTVVVPDNAAVLTAPAYRDALMDQVSPSLAYGQSFTKPGLYIMESQTSHWVETLVGLGATGVEVMLACVSDHPMQGHPMIPLIQVSAESLPGAFHRDVDLVLDGDPDDWASRMLDKVCSVASRQAAPRTTVQGNTDFQITRGLLGVSM